MPAVKAVVTACDMVTAYGWGVEPCWQGLLSHHTALSKVGRFNTEALKSDYAGTVKELDASRDDSLVMQMLTPLLQNVVTTFPEDMAVLLATTTGEIDLLEKHVLNGDGDPDASRLTHLLGKVCDLCGTARPGLLISAACASSTAALAQAAARIRSGEDTAVLVVACDSVTEFVYSGFSTLMALADDTAQPFDKNRQGLSLGEATGYILLMSEDQAREEGRPVLGEIAGWGLSNDANHMTGPSRDGGGLARAIEKAFGCAHVEAGEVRSVCAHGTGTMYNDSMEMLAFRQIFEKHAIPTYSIKGAIGHTLGAAGLVETLVSLWSLRDGVIPPTVNATEIADDAAGWVSTEQIEVPGQNVALTTNSGFGGINAALVLKSEGNNS